MQFTYKNKEDGRVVKRDSEWDSAEASADWERVDNSVSAGSDETPGAEEPAAEPVAKDEGEAPEEDNLDDLTRSELDDRANSVGVEDPDKLPNKAAVISAIRDAEGEAPEED
jgi:hypothetical protein